MNYDKKRHFELLNQSGDEFKSKLRTYWIIQFNHLNWEVRYQYLELLDKFIEKKIDSFNFQITFCERYESIEKVADLLELNLVLLSPDKNSLNFGDLLFNIDDCCKAYYDDPEPFRHECEIGDVEFQISIEKIYLKIQKLLNF